MNPKPDYTMPDFREQSWLPQALAKPEPYHATVPDSLAVARQLCPEMKVSVLDGRSSEGTEELTYPELEAEAHRFAVGLRELGVQHGDRVVLVLPTGLQFLGSFLGAQLIGAIPVPVYPPNLANLDAGRDRVQGICAHSGARFCVCASNFVPPLESLAGKGIRLIDATELPRNGHIDDIRVGPDDVAMIQYTSGSTGNPKGVVLYHRNLMATVHGVGQALEICEQDVLVNWCPLYHDLGLIGTFIFSIYWRIPLVLLSPITFLVRPSTWLRAISDYRGTLSPAPNFGYALAVRRVKPRDREGLDLSSWRAAMTGAEMVAPDTVRAFQETYEPYGLKPTASLPVYGMAEAALGIAIPLLRQPQQYLRVDRDELASGQAVAVETGFERAAVIASVGRALPGHELRVVDEQGRPVPDRVVGEVITRGPAIMPRYFEDEDATSRSLRDGWLWTGDLGFIDQGDLFLTGRAKDIVIVAGQNYNAEDIEQCVETVSGIRPGASIAFGTHHQKTQTEKVIVVCETKEDDPERRKVIIEDAAATVHAKVGIEVREVCLVAPGTVPKTSSGKRRRQQCRLAYLDGRYAAQ